MKNLAIILSHCDTSPKIDVLKQQIELLKNLEIDTLLISHIPLDPSLQKEVAYYIYDQDNPLLYWPERVLKCWDKTVGMGTLPIGLTCVVPDYGWTAMDQILKATNFALPLQYDYYSFINYDATLTPELQEYLCNPSRSGCPVTVTHAAQRYDENDKDPTSFSTLFTMLEHTVLSQVGPNINKSDFLKCRVAEDYWRKLLSPYSYFTLPSPVIDTMSVETEGRPESPANQNHFNNHFKVFFQNGNEPDKPRLTRAYFYKVEDTIQIECNDQTHLIKKASVIELPKNVTRLGIWDKDVYCDFLPEFNKAAAQYHSITQFDSDDDLLKTNLN